MPVDRDKLMDQTRAARCYVDQVRGGAADAEMAALLALFHPELSEEKRRELVLGTKTNGEARHGD